MTLKLGMLPVLSRINSSATKELNKSWANNRTSLLCTRHWVVFCHTLRKAYELDQLPNEKGKVKPSSRKISKGILGANHVYYINGGAYYFDQKDYNKSLRFLRAIEKYLICRCLKVRLSLKEIQTS